VREEEERARELERRAGREEQSGSRQAQVLQIAPRPVFREKSVD
jgi:hypothetical protein